MKKEPKLTDYIFHPSTLSPNGVNWHHQSIREDIINSETVEDFYKKFGDNLHQGIIDCLNDGSDIEILIDKISELASAFPAININWEKQQIPNSIKNQEDLINWRKEVYWKKNVKYITESILLASNDLYFQEKNKYKDYIKLYNSLTKDEKRDFDKLEELGLF
ncbi:hypothetical protein [Aquirufa nivalisilvae]